MSEEEINNLSEKVELRREIIKKDKEIERLNNIINELDKFIEKEIERVHKNGIDQYDYFMSYAYENTLDKLKELKRSDKE